MTQYCVNRLPFNKILHFFLAVWILASVFPRYISANPHRVVAIDCPAPERGPARRVYFEDPSGSEERLLMLRERLLEAGAYHVNVFLPSHLVCMLPDDIPLSDVVGEWKVHATTEADIEAPPPDSPFANVAWLKSCYEMAERNEPSARKPGDEIREDWIRQSIRDSVRILEPEYIMRSYEQMIESGATVSRRIDQNCEFMVGTIIVNLILPESQYLMENWDEDDLSDALKSALAAVLRYQNLYQYAPMNLLFRAYQKAHTGYEPSHHPFEDHEDWIKDVMKYIMEYMDPHWDAPQTVHYFHEKLRKRYQTDWIFTVFIVKAQNVEYHRIWLSENVGYSIMGGPYAIVPFPAGDILLGDRRYTLQIHLQHEIGHIFWAMDEGLLDQGWSCWNTSGYLNSINGNKIEDIIANVPVNECSGICVPCIMDRPEKSAHGLACEYTAAQMGIVDWNENGVVDVFDSDPIVEFENTAAETIAVDKFTIKCKATSIPIPNRNYKQDTTYWIDYASPLKKAVLNINGYGNFFLTPVDGEWGDLEEELSIPVVDLSVGLTSVEILVYNSAGLRSTPKVKNILRAGLRYALFSVIPRSEGLELSWYAFGETFGARYDLYRIEQVEGTSDTIMVGADVKPSGDQEGHFLPFYYFDRSIEPSKVYWYFVRGTYSLRIQGGPVQEFKDDSELYEAKAVIPIPKGDIVSPPTPNPFREYTSFSVIIPKSFKKEESSMAPSPGGIVSHAPGLWEEISTPVAVSVYDVAGRRVKSLIQDRYIGTTITFEWDGTNDRNVKVPSGLYFLKVEAGDKSQVRKVTLLR